METNQFYITLTGRELADLEFESYSDEFAKRFSIIEQGYWGFYQSGEQSKDIIIMDKSTNLYYKILITRTGTSAGGYHYSFYNRDWKVDEDKTYNFPKVVPIERTTIDWVVLR